MKIDFYSVEGPEDLDLNAVLNSASAVPDDDSRVRELSGVPFRLQRLNHGRGIWTGEIVRIRMNDIPIICGLDGSVDEVELDDDEGIGEETAFLFHPATNSLVIQRNRLGVSSSRLMAYLERLTDTEGLLAVMILNADVASALNRLQIVRKMHVRLASVKNPRLLTSHNPSTTEAIEILNAKAPVVDITVAMGRQRGSLSLQAIRSAAKRFLSWSGATDAPGDVEALKIDGKYDDESPAELDLLEYRMVERADVEPDPQSRRLLYEDRIRALKEAFERRKGELENMFAEEE
ncbi:MAG: DUF6731 family protein [Pirellulaceae bacterium]